jgi:formate hydrogenlyase transcriptional activator
MDSAGSQTHKGSLLVVDDELSVRRAMETLLVNKGYEVRCAPDARMALLFAEEDPPELILLDIRLPDMDGFEVCRRLKEGHKTADIPVIFISALGEMMDKIRGFAVGAVDYIIKPFDAGEVVARVESHLALKRLHSKIAGQNRQLEREIARSKKAEAALLRAHDELDRRVTERTGELARANEQLAESNEQLSREIEQRVQAQEALQERLQFETLLTDISARFVNLPADRIDGEIEDAQRRICECLRLDLSSLWQWPAETPSILTLTHLYRPLGGPPPPERTDAHEYFPWSQQQLTAGKVVAVSSMAELPAEAARDQEVWRHYGIKTSLTIPLLTGGGPPIGVLSFNTMRAERTWPEAFVKRLQLVAQIFTNALARKRSDEILREGEARLSLATDAAGAGLWIMEIDTGNVWVSAKTRELFHFASDEALNYESFLKVIHPEDREQVKQAVQQALDSGESLQLDYRIVLPDGSIRWLGARGQRHLKATGEPARMMGVSLDITERKLMESQLKLHLQEIEQLKQRLETENLYLQEEVKLRVEHKEIVAQSLAMKKVLAQVEQVAMTDSTVLIQGETGTGKELLARELHRLSSRKDRPLVTVSCASLPPTLIESELFGRERGAYTGALTKMVGRFEIADGSTLFLDEIGEFPVELQSKLLRVLEEGKFERLGSTKPLHVNVRIIAATNRDLEHEVTESRFRKDLFYRLHVFPIMIPPLRERREDIPLMVWAFVREFQKRLGKEIETISRKTMEALQSYSWPGNVRELRNVIEHAMILSKSKALVLPLPKLGSSEIAAGHTLEDMERKHIEAVLERTGWRLGGRGGAAEILGMKRSTLYSRMKKLGVIRRSR